MVCLHGLSHRCGHIHGSVHDACVCASEQTGTEQEQMPTRENREGWR